MARKIVSSKKTIAARTSPSGVGRSSRMGEVRHSTVISSSRRRSRSSRSDRGRRGSSRRCSRAAIRRCATSTVRRRASVGCAVKTGLILSRSSNGPMSPLPRQAATAASTLSSSGVRRPARSRCASTRSRCLSSTRFVSRK